jgi:hypothetical protein
VRTFLQVSNAMSLTERKIETLTAGGEKNRLVLVMRSAAFVRVAGSSRTYLANTSPWVSLGSCSALSLSKAREAAAAVMGDVAKGRNPAAFPRRARNAIYRAGRKRSQRSTPHPVFRHSVHPLRYCMGLHGIARPMTLCRGRSPDLV